MPAPLISDWPALLDLAERTKTIGLLPRGLEAVHQRVPDEIQKRLKAAQDRVTLASLFNLKWTIKVVQALTEDGLDVLAFKGAVQTSSSYGGVGLRRSVDIDLLVGANDFRAAAESLKKHGFEPALDEDDTWWSDHLGEAPYYNPKVPGVMIDLHHRVQQPGGPFPKHTERLFTDSRIAEFGGAKVPVLSKGHSALVTAISYGKAQREGSPWIDYAHELLFVYHRLTVEERASLNELAEYHGLLRLLNEALSAAHSLFTPVQDADHDLDQLDRDQLLMSAIGQIEPRSFFRSRKLWEWTDGSPPTRVFEFSRGLLRVLRSELVRSSQERAVAAREKA